MNKIGFRFTLIAIIVMVFITIGYFLYLPNISISPEYIDLGVLNQGQKAQRIVSVRNNNMRSVRILSVETFCECTKARVDKNILNQGDTTDLHIYFDSATLTGKIMRMVSIKTDARANSTLFIPVSCDVTNNAKIKSALLQ